MSLIKGCGFIYHFIIFLYFGVTVPLHLNANTDYHSLSLVNFLNQSQTTAHKRNQLLCYSVEDSTPGLPCNPAFLAIPQERQTWVYFHGNDNLKYFENISDIIEGPSNMSQVEPLLDHNSTDQFQFSGSLGYRKNGWGFAVVPETLTLFTHFRNPSLPRISLLAVRESQIQFQAASFFDRSWAWGLQFRTAFRRLSYNDTFITDHFLESGETLYPITTQTSLYIEPSLMYAPPHVTGRPQLTVMATQGGSGEKKGSPFKNNPNLVGTISTQTDYSLGSLKLASVTYWVNDEKASQFYSGLGLDFSMEDFTLFATYMRLQHQFGLALNSKTLTCSLSYLEQDWSDSAPNSSKFTSLLRWDLGLKF